MAETRKFLAANWKMNLVFEEAATLSQKLKYMLRDISGSTPVALLPAFPYLHVVGEAIAPLPFLHLGAQHVAGQPGGALTGEVSAAMLASVGCAYCLVGHSERRRLLGENAAAMANRIRCLLEEEVWPIYCVGETQEQRSAGRTFEVLRDQLDEALGGMQGQEAAQFVIAYEPVWAIGSGNTATPEQASEAHRFIRNWYSEKFGEIRASRLPIVYGGSVNAENAGKLFSEPHIDGGLVGGASLKAEEFIEIYKTLDK